MDLAKLRDSLLDKGYDKTKVSKFVAYLAGESDKGSASPVLKNKQGELYNMFVKYYNAGTNIDGVNVVITGNKMALITANGYRNKLKQLYPDLFLDVQLVREGDTFEFEKNDGKVSYTHKIGSPFEAKKIIGAYCVLRYGNGNELLETLNPEDFAKMKDSSRNQSTWNKWESEFWKKSVVKRASKTNFSEEVSQLDELDNTDYGLEDEKANDETKNEILKAHANKNTTVTTTA